MGTDIVLYAERRFEGEWMPVPEPAVTHWSKGKKVPIEPFELGRNYNLFSVLVGEGMGVMSAMARIPSLDAFPGYPPDLSAFYRRCFRPERTRNSSESPIYWLPVRKIVDFDWDRPVIHSAFVDSWNADLFLEEFPFPEDFPKDGRILHNVFLPPPEGTKKVSWTIPLRDYVRGSERFIKLLLELGPPDDVRIIFYFLN